MAEKRRGGKPTDVLSVSLFLLEDRNVERINKNMCTKSAIERLKEMGYGPPPDKFLQEKGKIHFSFLITTEEFKNKLVEIYPKLQPQCYLLMRADKSNKLQYLDIASSSYNPKEIYNSNLGQGRLYIRFATETEVTTVNCMPPPPKIRRIMLQCRAIRPKPAGLILPNSVSNSASSVPDQKVKVSQASTSVEKHHTLPQNAHTTSNNTGTIFPAADNDSLAESIVQCLLQNNELGMKVISGLLQKLDSGLENVSTNNASMLGSTNANGTLTSLDSHNNLQTPVSVSQSISPYRQPPDNQ